MGCTTVLIIHDAPAHQIRLLRAVRAEHSLAEYSGLEVDDKAIVLGARYSNVDYESGCADEIAAALGSAPDIWFTVYDNPSEGLGVIYRRDPELGMWRGSAHEGEPVFTAAEIDVARAADALDELVGRAWLAKTEALWTDGAEPVRALTEPKVYELEWNRRTGQLSIAESAGDGDDDAPFDRPVLGLHVPAGELSAEVDRGPVITTLAAAGFRIAGAWSSEGRHDQLQYVDVYLLHVPTCPDCGAGHDPRPCAQTGDDSCACCAVLYPTYRRADRAAASSALTVAGVPRSPAAPEPADADAQASRP